MIILVIATGSKDGIFFFLLWRSAPRLCETILELNVLQFYSRKEFLNKRLLTTDVVEPPKQFSNWLASWVVVYRHANWQGRGRNEKPYFKKIIPMLG
jgi:hypothetical protein